MSGWLVHVIAAVALLAPSEPPAGTPQVHRGSLPVPTSPQVVAGGEVLLELEVGASGRVTRVTTLRETPPFTNLVQAAVAQWTFEPVAGDTGGRALVAAVFRPPILGPGPVAGIPPRDVGAPSPSIPFPVDMVVPSYPVTAMGDGEVLIQVSVESDGAVTEARVIEARGPFLETALEAARGWRFRPGRYQGQPVATLAYLIFGFRSPVTTNPPSGGR